MTGPTRRIAAQCLAYRYDALPANARRVATLCVIDHLGCAVRGAAEPLSAMLAEELFGEAVSGASYLPTKRPPESLVHWALLQGATAHAIDFDDTFVPGRAAHAGASVVGSTLTLGGHLGASGEALLTAIVAGYETAARIDQLLTDAHYEKGFHPTGTVGVFAATAACCRLMALDEEKTQSAFGLAATQAAGLKSTFGTMAKPFNAGRAGSNGLLAARLAARGFTANSDGLEADKGYLELFLGLPAAAQDVEGPEKFWILMNAFKLHAACHALHPMIEAIGRIKERHGVAADDVARIEVAAAPLSLKTASVGVPSSGLECKFSFAQTAAVALAGLDTASDQTYSDAILSDARVNALRDKTVVVEAPIQPFETRVAIETTDGETYVAELDLHELMQDLARIGEQVEAKFLANAAPSLGAARAADLLSTLQQLDRVTSVAEAFA